MITERTGDLLAQTDLTHIAHQANLYRVMGAGIAAKIAAKFPSAEYADNETGHGDYNKLGTFSVGLGLGHPAIINLYSQRGIGGNFCQTDYNALKAALTTLEAALRMVLRYEPNVKLGLPHGLGCGLAGGDWELVRGIIESVFEESPVAVVIVQLPVAAAVR